MIATVVCPRCNERRAPEDFARDASKANGRKSICRACDSARSRRYYEANRERVIARQIAARPPRSARKCKLCGEPATSSRHWYCDRCREARRRRRGRERDLRRAHLTPAQRGYDARHRLVRRRVARIVAAGAAVCWRCQQPIAPDEPWDLGHDDYDRSKYNGPEHPACNRATAGRPRQRTSRDW